MCKAIEVKDRDDKRVREEMATVGQVNQNVDNVEGGMSNKVRGNGTRKWGIEK